MKRVYLVIILILLFPFQVNATSLECPSVATQGEDIVCKFKENDIIGLKIKYEVDPIFTYLGVKVNEPWKGYYTGGKGLVVGNITDTSELQGEVVFQVGMNAVSGKEYSVGLSEIEVVKEGDVSSTVEDVSTKVRIVSDIHTLSTLKISNGSLSPKFSSDVMSYQATVKVGSIDIQATATDSNAKIEGDIGQKNLNYGVNTFTIKVISERGNTREYKLYITRVAKSKDTSLKSLKVNGKELELKSDSYYYSIDVDNDVENVEIDAIPNNNSSSVSIQKPEQLVIGENQISIKVTAEDGSECTYVVVVNRQRKLSSDNFIKSLSVKGYDLIFSSDKYNYELIILDEKKLDIDVILNDEKASYKIIGNKDLKSNQEIQIIVTAENGDKKTYTIKVVREVESNSDSITGSIRIVPLIVFIVLILSILIIRKMRKKVSE